jgi:hypothetical protein
MKTKTNGRATRSVTGPGWKPDEPSGLEGSSPSPSAGGCSLMVKRLIVAQVHAGSSPVDHLFNQIRRISQSPVLDFMPCECDGQHGGLRNRKTGFNSSARYCETRCPWSVPDRTRAREARRPGSIPGEDACTTLEPDGTATGCKCGSSGFDSHQRL